MNDDIAITSKNDGHLNCLEINGHEINIDKLPFYKKYPIKFIALLLGGVAMIGSFLALFISVPFIGLLMLLTIKERSKLEETNNGN
jgi:hypothetical protein